ncbi:uncharacterized protein [Typha angustifolia]|uniref:uncharacterized protein n=1 Tax=Typha angustifolia TaxID=59011 RepID=UPI003C2DBCB0
MSSQRISPMVTAALVLLLEILVAFPKNVESIGVCYGMLGNNLPQPSDVVGLYKSNKIGSMRLYAPNTPTFQALKGTNIQLLLDVPNDNLQSIASSPQAATTWIKNNVAAYSSDVAFRYIAVGNEVIPGDNAQYVLPAMKNIYNALSAAGLQDKIKVSTSVSQGVLGQSYPPSSGAFSSAAQQTLGPIVQFLASKGAPLLVNVYPYFSYAANPSQIDLKYALFTSPGTVVTDGKAAYQNLFDALVDALYSALEKAGGSNVAIVVSESGWPSAGGTATTPQNAQTYNQNLIRHVGKGTPKRPGKAIETYIFAMFNENQKPAGIEQNWGLFYPNKKPVYQISFTLLVLIIMASQRIISMVAVALLLLEILVAFPKNVKSIGVCYGMLGDNLPQPSDVVGLYKSNNIGSMRLYGPDTAALNALKGSNIQLLLDVPNENLQSIANSPQEATNWIQNNVSPYSSDVAFRYIAVGNEVIPGDNAQYVLPAMNNIYNALSAAGLQDKIKVSTSVSQGVLGQSYPPSSGAFSSAAQQTLGPIVQFLASKGAPLLVNVYPYFSYAGNPGQIEINYALFTSTGTVVTDGNAAYQNLFDALVDALYSALEKAGGSNVAIVVSESGWPSAGGTATTPQNAQTYNQNLIQHVGKGTPKRPGIAIETYIFAMFNEDQKPAGIEQNWGLFYPTKQPVYQINFS